MIQQKVTDAIEVYCAYAPEDEQFCEKLERHLAILKRQGFIRTWYAHRILPGTERLKEQKVHLDCAQLILLFISDAFLSSDDCYETELQRALERHEAGEARVIPLIVRPVLWEQEPVLYQLQPLPPEGKPITRWPNMDDAFEAIVRGIQQVIEQDFLAPLGASHRGPSSIPSRIWHVPLRRNLFFTGRDVVLETLHYRLKSGRTVALTQVQAIKGLGGIGKTQIALEYAYRYQKEYQAILWISAASQEVLITEMSMLAEALGLPERHEAEQEMRLMAVRRWLTTQHGWLLILDNADDLALIDEMLPSRVSGHVLITTRSHSVGTLAESINIEEMSTEEGTLLLLRRAHILQYDESLAQASQEDRLRAEAIVIILDGLPLALDQAGAYLEETGCDLQTYLALYQSRRRDLLQRRGHLPTNHPETVATTWSLAFQQIGTTNVAAADLLRLCAFLDPDAIPEELFTKGASVLETRLAKVVVDPLQFNEATQTLYRYSLIRRQPHTRTLRIHRLVQAVLRDGMTQREQQRWAACAVKAIHASFPRVNGGNVRIHERFLAQAQSAVLLITNFHFTFVAATSLLHRLGLYWRHYARYDESEALFRQTLLIREQVLGPEHFATANTLQELATLHQQQGKHTEAEMLYQRALSIREQVLGPEDANTASTLHGLALLYQQQGKHTEAEMLYQRALSIKELTLGTNHPATANTLEGLARIYQAQEKYDEAEAFYQRALHIFEQTIGLEHSSTTNALHGLATLYQAQEKYDRAEQLYQQTLRIKEQVFGLVHPSTATTLQALATLYQQQGKHIEAEARYQRALDIFEQALGPEHPSTVRHRQNYAFFQQQHNQKDTREL